MNSQYDKSQYMRQSDIFQQWRDEARTYLSANTSPEDVSWSGWSGCDRQTNLFAADKANASESISVPKDFFALAKIVALHRDLSKWTLLYRILWRLKNGQKFLLSDLADADMLMLARLKKNVTRDIHKMHAFVRFEEESDGSYFAWYEPDHHILEASASFFVRRFGSMSWRIATPDGTANWDKEQLNYKPANIDRPIRNDPVDELWKGYYSSIFNPARVKEKAMKREMPKRFWKNLPEAGLIQPLVSSAAKLVAEMAASSKAVYPEIRRERLSVLDPNQALPELGHALNSCTACPLHQFAGKPVPGEGNAHARLMLIGEQPGDEEDKVGRPFVGQAGQVLDQALRAVQIPREEIYLTNAVKHFKFEPVFELGMFEPGRRGKRRLHKRPNSQEVHTCKFWLQHELSLINPEVVVCLGATAAQSLLGREVKINKERGAVIFHNGMQVVVTFHPSYVLRNQDTETQKIAFSALVDDLRIARRMICDNIEAAPKIGNNSQTVVH
jgi:uracil-DNA glycosylase